VQLSISLGPPADPTPPTAPAADPVPDGATEAKPEEGVLYDMGSKVVNLADPGGYRYLKVGIVLEVLPADPEFYALSGEARKAAEDQLRETLDEKRPIIEDVVTVKLSSKTFEEVFTVTGKEQLKQELRDDLNARLTVGQVRDIYFTDFMVQ
jgi:Flagellar basal body-associated protein